MPTRVESYREVLRHMEEWEPYLLANSCLPGPRGNLELAEAVADLGTEAQFLRWVAAADEFLAFCGTAGLGRLLAEGSRQHLALLRRMAGDGRWRVREVVAFALQRWGDADMNGLLAEMAAWSRGTYLEQRAAMAGLCEPRLLKDPAHAGPVLAVLDAATAAVAAAPDKSADLTVLVKGLSYGWSVAAAAYPEQGKAAMERWLAAPTPLVRTIMRENLKKNRLTKTDPEWASRALNRL